MWFKKKRKTQEVCQHSYDYLGRFYKETFADLLNSFDHIDVYEKYRCRLCGNIKDTLLSSEKFVSELKNGKDKKDAYIKYLVDNGCKLEIALFDKI